MSNVPLKKWKKIANVVRISYEVRIIEVFIHKLDLISNQILYFQKADKTTPLCELQSYSCISDAYGIDHFLRIT